MSDSVGSDLEKPMRAWLTTASLEKNMLSHIKARRDTAVLLKFNALAKLSPEEAMTALGELAEMAGGGQ